MLDGEWHSESPIDPFRFAKERGIFHSLDMPDDTLTTPDIVERIVANRLSDFIFVFKVEGIY